MTFEFLGHKKAVYLAIVLCYVKHACRAQFFAVRLCTLRNIRALNKDRMSENALIEAPA
jgi:hypothetical protein